jgi:hypothetical protein
MNAGFLHRFGRCEFYKPISIASTPGVEYAIFSQELWWSEANTVCGTLGKRLVITRNPTIEEELHAAITSIAGNTYC